MRIHECWMQRQRLLTNEKDSKKKAEKIGGDYEHEKIESKIGDALCTSKRKFSRRNVSCVSLVLFRVDERLISLKSEQMPSAAFDANRSSAKRFWRQPVDSGRRSWNSLLRYFGDFLQRFFRICTISRKKASVCSSLHFQVSQSGLDSINRSIREI